MALFVGPRGVPVVFDQEEGWSSSSAICRDNQQGDRGRIAQWSVRANPGVAARRPTGVGASWVRDVHSLPQVMRLARADPRSGDGMGGAQRRAILNAAKQLAEPRCLATEKISSLGRGVEKAGRHAKARR